MSYQYNNASKATTYTKFYLVMQTDLDCRPTQECIDWVCVGETLEGYNKQ